MASLLGTPKQLHKEGEEDHNTAQQQPEGNSTENKPTPQTLHCVWISETRQNNGDFYSLITNQVRAVYLVFIDGNYQMVSHLCFN